MHECCSNKAPQHPTDKATEKVHMLSSYSDRAKLCLVHGMGWDRRCAVEKAHDDDLGLGEASACERNQWKTVHAQRHHQEEEEEKE